MRRVAGIAAVIAIALASCGGSEAAPTVSIVTTAATVTTTSTTAAPTTTTTETSTTTITAVPPTTTTTPPPGPARYRLVVENSWSEETHAGAFPSDAHFSWLAGATHDDTVSLWTVGSPSGTGVTEMAETGVTAILVREIKAGDGVGETLDWAWWFCPAATKSSRCGESTVEFDIDADYPYVSLAAMIGPSPDWFVGVDSLLLLDGGKWRDEVVVVLTPYDGGTRTGNRFALFGPRNDPPEPISVVTNESAQLIGPQAIGTYAFVLLPGN